MRVKIARQDEPTNGGTEGHRQTNTKTNEQSRSETEQAYVEADVHRLLAWDEPSVAHPLPKRRDHHQEARQNRADSQSGQRTASVTPFMQDFNRLAGRQTIRVRQVLFIDVVTAHRYRQQNSEQARTAKPTENLQRVEINRRVKDALRI